MTLRSLESQGLSSRLLLGSHCSGSSAGAAASARKEKWVPAEGSQGHTHPPSPSLLTEVAVLSPSHRVTAGPGCAYSQALQPNPELTRPWSLPRGKDAVGGVPGSPRDTRDVICKDQGPRGRAHIPPLHLWDEYILWCGWVKRCEGFEGGHQRLPCSPLLPHAQGAES